MLNATWLISSAIPWLMSSDFREPLPFVPMVDLLRAAVAHRALDLDDDSRAKVARLVAEMASAKTKTRKLLESPSACDPESWDVADIDMDLLRPTEVGARVQEIIGEPKVRKLRAWHVWARGPMLAGDPGNRRWSPAAADVVKREYPRFLQRGVVAQRDRPLAIESLRARLGDHHCAALDRLIEEPTLGFAAALLDFTPRLGPFPLGLELMQGSARAPECAWLDNVCIAPALTDQAFQKALGAAPEFDGKARKTWAQHIGSCIQAQQSLTLFTPIERFEIEPQLWKTMLGRNTVVSDQLLAELPSGQRDDALAAFARIRGIGNVFNGTMRSALKMTSAQQDLYKKALLAPRAEYDRQFPSSGVFNSTAEADAFIAKQAASFGKRPPAPPLDLNAAQCELAERIMTAEQQAKWKEWHARKLPDGLQQAMEQALRNPTPAARRWNEFDRSDGFGWKDAEE